MTGGLEHPDERDNNSIMAKGKGLVNAPSTTGKPSGGKRGNNPPSTPKPKGK